ncbi:MAG TPA: ferritin-like domain-containing protein, partial [Polyangia bacterium]|nr:ferritin-like domain-containing protein [Polyangia bacterium]
ADGSADLGALTSGAGDGDWMAVEATRRRRRLTSAWRRAPAFDPAPYEASALARARHLWTMRATAEHESALIFAGLLPLALEAKASLDTQTVLVGMAEDELRHAAICAEVARRLGGDPPPARPTTIPRGARPIEEQLLRHVIYGNCMTETVNAARLVDAAEQACDPFLRGALLELLADEVRHARFGFVLLNDWATFFESRPDARRAVDEFLPGAFAALERTLSGAGASRAGFGDDDLALGSPDPGRLAEVFYRTVEEAVVPGLERAGFAASAAWQARARKADP